MNRKEMLAFRIAGWEWVIPIADIVEIVESPRVYRLPLLPKGAPGVIDVRGVAVPAIEIGDCEEVRRSAILTGHGSRQVALLIDSVDGIVDTAPENASVVDVAALLEVQHS